MLITFTSKYSPDVLMLGHIASTLLQAMGQSETPPGALQDENIKTAAERLRNYLQTLPDSEGKMVADNDEQEDENEQEEPPVGLAIRAKPLLDMLDKAYKEKVDVVWR